MESVGKEYVFIARVRDFPKNRGLVRTINEHEIAIFHIEGAFYAVSNICPHQHSPLLAEGIIEGKTVTCPLHGWKYSLETGIMEAGGGGIRTYPVRVEGDRVYVEKPYRPPTPSW